MTSPLHVPEANTFVIKNFLALFFFLLVDSNTLVIASRAWVIPTRTRTASIVNSPPYAMHKRAFLLVVALLLVLVLGAEAQLCFRVDEGPASDDTLGASRPRVRRVRHREDPAEAFDVLPSTETPDECVPVDVEALVVETVTETERFARGAASQEPVPTEAATRTCTCAAVRFVCGAHNTVSARLNRFARTPGTVSDDDDVFTALCGAPCDTNSACADDTNADADAACVAPVCEALCGACTLELREDRSKDASLDTLRGVCGDEHACLCAQCLEQNLFVETLGDTSEVIAGYEKNDVILGRFGDPNDVFTSGYGQSIYAPGYGGYGSQNPYRPGVGVSANNGQLDPGFGIPGNTPYGPYPGAYYPGWAIYKPWFVSVYSKSKALVVSSLCYWYPWYPSCFPPPPRPPPDIFPPRPPGNNPSPPPPSPVISPSPPVDNTCGDLALGDQTCSGIPCEGDTTCTTGTPQCCCDAGCFDFGDCCADRTACCGVLQSTGDGKGVRARERERDRTAGFQAFLEAKGRGRSARRRRSTDNENVANRNAKESVRVKDSISVTVPFTAKPTPTPVPEEKREALVFTEDNRLNGESDTSFSEFFAVAEAPAPANDVDYAD